MRCGYCHRDTAEIPVIVTSRGQRYESYAHKTCIRKWSKISQVEVVSDENVDSLYGDIRQWFSGLRKSARDSECRYEERKRNNPKPCPDCGNPIDRHSDHCVVCSKRYVDYSARGKLTTEQVEQIRELAGEYTLKQIATMYGISCSNVSLIVNEKTWRSDEATLQTSKTQTQL